MTETATVEAGPAPSTSPPVPRGRHVDVEALYRSSAEDLFAYARSVVRDDALAEEVVAVTFERAVARSRRFDARRGSPRAWLFGIARNAAVDELRRRGKHASFEHDPPDDRVPDPGDDLARRDEDRRRRAVLSAALDALPGADRELVALKFHAGLTNVEIGRLVGISSTNAGSRLHRVVTTLREACRAAS